MKVLILLKFPYFGNGSGNYTRRLAENLAKDPDIQVAIAAPDKRPVEGVKIYQIKPPFRAVYEGHPEWRGAKKYSQLSPDQFTRLYNSYLEQIIRIVEDFKPDVIHVNHASFLNWIASYIKSFYGITFVTTLHGTGIYLASIDNRFRVLTGQSLDRAEQIIAVAPFTKKWFLKVFGQRLRRKTRVIPAGVKVKNFENLELPKDFDKKYQLGGKKVALFVGRLTKEKGVEYLIRAAKNIHGLVCIAGDGPEMARLQNLAKLVGADNVRFLGYFGKKQAVELRQLYARANVLVLPSVVDEALGLVILEAMAAQTPIIASNKGGIPLVVKNGKNGILIRARSPKALHTAINSVFDNPERAEQMAVLAHRTVLEKFDWSKLIDQVKQIYVKAENTTRRLQGQLGRQADKVERDIRVRQREELAQKISSTIEVGENEVDD